MSGQTETVSLQVNAIGNFSQLTGELNKFKSQLQALKLPKDVMSNVEKAMDNVAEKANKFQLLLSKGIKNKGDYSRLVSGAREYEAAMTQLDRAMDKVGNKEIKAAVFNSSEIKNAEAQLEKLYKQQREIANFGTNKGAKIINESSVAEIQKLIGSTAGLKKKFNAVSDAFKTGNIDQANTAITALIKHVEQYQSKLNTASQPKRGDNILDWAKKVREYLSTATADVNKFQASFNQLKADKTKQIETSMRNISSATKSATNEMRQQVNAQLQMADSANQMNEQVGHLRTQANYFFGLQNIGRLISRGIREAAESVRDLDKAMTETAVVTDFSVGDMWNMLPEYTKLANELGATTQGAYETMTLYFQQGLDKQATFEIGEETMKMARIAGLDYAQTTNMMTAALRGFNMELNQTSAKRVNDVYSELAAITASDTRELGLAMERTASIAHSAGMDFGNTTAFLAQMIETTREAPENLGTAMKTIIARFQELKENPYAISEVEGEEVDYNRVDKALKSIGVDLMDNKDKFRDLDDVFMDISERWDGLSQTQQRYVATIAAGARQQSRFLAMVQNYDRLKQLTDAAANSEGASDVQFNKTLESYEAKMNKLKNAWQAFTMSLANNHAIKGGIDILKDIITFGNKIIQTFGSVGKIFGETGKGIAEMGAAFGLGALGFKTLKGGANLGLRMLGGMTVKGATMDGGMFPGGITSKGSIGLASRISNPIVSAINKLTAVVSKESVDTGFRNKLVQEKRGDLYNKARQSEVVSKIPETKLERALSKGNVYHKKSYLPFSAKDIQSEFKDLNNLEQQQLYKSIPSIRNALQDGYTKAYKGLKIDKAGEAALTAHFRKIDQAVQSGKISATDAFKHLYNPQSVAQAIDNPEVTKALNTALQKQMKSWSPEKERSMGQKLKYLADKKGLEGEARGQFYRDAKQRFAGKELGETFSGKQTAQLGKVAGAMSKVSGMAAQAGQSVMGLGMMLDSLGMHGAGAAVMTIGNGLVGLGMAAEGAVGAVKALKTAFAALNAINPMLAGLGAIAAIGAVTIGAVTAINKKIVKDTRETGERVVKAYTKTKEKTIEQLDNLKKYRENWEVWSAGVDEYGNNINLGTEEYQEYLKAVKDITSAHPELIKGYNALGNAYIDNNTALKKAADLVKKDEKEALNTYLNSYDEIVAKQKTYKRWTNAMSSGGQNAQNTTTMAITKGAAGRTVNASSASNMADQANAVVESIQKIDGSEKILKDFNIELDSTGKLTETGLENLRTHLQDVTNTVKATDLAPSKETQEQFDNMTEAANTYAKTVQGLEKVSEDTYDWGWTYASKKGYDKIDSNLIVPFQTSIKRLAEQGLSQSEMTSGIDALGSKYQNLGGYLEDFKKIQDKVNEAAITLGEDANFDAYTDKVENLTAPIDAWIGSLKDAGGQSNQILAEFFENQVAVMLDYQAQASEILSQGLNQDQNLFTSASQASEKYQKRKEEIVDYSSGIQDAKEILDDAMTDINLEGQGSLNFEQAAISIVGEDFVDRNVNDMDEVKKQMKEYQGWLQDSEGNARSLEDTYISFWDHITQKAMDSPDKTIEGIDGKLSDFFVKTEDGFEMNAEKWSALTDEQMGLLAEKGFDMSSDFMASMLNIGRQLGYYSSADPSKIRQGLVQQEGQGTAVSQESGRVYKKESDFEEESRLAQNSKSETENLKKEAEKQNVVLLDEAKNLSKSTVKQMMDDFGVSGKDAGKKFAETFSDIGYDKEGVDTALATALQNENLDEGTRKSLEDYRTNLDSNWAKLLEDKAVDFDTEDGTIESIDSHAASIDANTAQLLAKDGALDKNAYGYDPSDKTGEKSGKGYEALQYILGEKGRDTKAQYFASGKDAEGNKLSESTYQEWQSQLQNRLSEYQTQVALAQTNAQNTTGEDKTWWENQASSYALAAQYLQDYITKGQQAHDEKKAQNEEDETSNDEKTRKKTENDQKETESDQAKTESESQNKLKLSDEYQKYLDSFNQMQTGEEQPTLLTPDQLAAKFGLSDADIADYQSRYQQLQQQLAANPYSSMGLSQEQGDILGLKKTFADGQTDLTNFKNTFSQVTSALGPDLQLTKGQLEQIKQNINGLDASQLNSLDTSQLLADLKLDNEQIAALEAANINIPVETDDKNLDDTKKKKDDLEKPVQIPVTTNTSNIEGEQNKQDAPKEGVSETQKVTKNLEVTYITTISNEGEITAYLDSKISSIVKNAKSNKNLNLRASITVDYKKGKQAKADKKSATVDYKKGQQEDAKDQKAKVNYVRGKQEDPKSPRSAKVNYEIGSQASPKDKHAKVYYDPAEKGKNNHIARQSLPTFNSLAVGNVKKQPYTGATPGNGLTLTGEKGFEIAWLPSENRSMILGAKGPQMVNLPKDAVVWTNEQSKKIMKQKAIPAASMRKGSAPKKNSSSSGGSGGGSGSSSRSSRGSSRSSRGSDRNNDDKKTNKKVKQIVGKVSVWWDNQTRKVEGTQRKVDKTLKAFEAEAKRIGATRKSINNEINNYKKQLKRSINLNNTSIKTAKKGLRNLDLSKKASKRTISFEKKVRKKENKKWKTTKKTVKGTVYLNSYIKYDPYNDTYTINQKAINKAAKKNKSRAKAIKELANKEINDLLSKRNTARDNVAKAKEALDKLANDVYETFYKWEKTINKVYLYAQKLELISSQLSIASANLDLQFAKLRTGAGSTNQTTILGLLDTERNKLIEQARGKNEDLSAKEADFRNSLKLDEYLKDYQKNPNSSEAKGELVAAKKALDFLASIDMDNDKFNYDTAISKLNKANYNETTYNEIKSILDKIFEKQNDYMGAIEAAYQAQTEIYEKLEEIQTFIADFEQEILDGLEQQIEDQIDKLDKINASLTKALKNLLDEVKRKLDERRQKEDNEKTESDLSKKRQRLTLLRADTSGGNATEIAKLENEIAEAQQNYQRSLEDQLIERLQNQADKAEEQRQRQIELLQTQADISKQTGINLALLKQWLENPEANEENFKQAWLASQEYETAPPEQQEKILNEWKETWAKFLAYRQEEPKYLASISSVLPGLERAIKDLSKSWKTGTNHNTAARLRKAGMTAKQAKDAGFSVKSLREGGYKVGSIVGAGYKGADLRKAGVTAKDLKKAKISAAKARSLGYSAKELKQASYSTKSIVNAGYSKKALAKAGITMKSAIASGASRKRIAKTYGASAAMRVGNISGKDAQAGTGASAKTLQKIINKSKKDKAVQKDMAGAQVGKVDVNGKKKGGTVKDSHLSSTGTTIGANKGSTLYTKDWDEKTGTPKSGAWSGTTVDKLTVAQLQKYPIDGRQALEYAIRHQKPGTKINKNIAKLIPIAKIAGKKYTLSNKANASLSAKGVLYWNMASGNIKKWNTATGKLTEQKYNKKTYLKEAQKNNNVSREYAQALIAKKAFGKNTKKQLRDKYKVKKFATGGLADQTGLAWLDGTPTKPELVLDAQDTKNFMALKDVLSHAMSSTNSAPASYGDTNIEVNVNVDHIDSDYDVDRLVQRIKKDITKDAGYRNVTQVRKLR